MDVHRGQTEGQPPMPGEIAEDSLGPLSVDHDFWQSLKVYPAAIGHDETRGVYQKRARETLASLPLSNVRFLCTRLGIEYAETEDLPQPLVHRLMSSEHAPLLTCLSEYLKRHLGQVVDFFDKRMSDQFVRGVVREISSASRGGHETPRPFTKLLAIFQNRRDDLSLIHYTLNWRKIPTVREFQIDGGAPADAGKRMVEGMQLLLRGLDKLKDGEEYSYFGTNTVRQGLDVFVLHRNYRTSVKPDYRDRYRLQHDYGQVVFGLNVGRSTIVIKVGNQAIRDAICSWIRKTLDVELRASGAAIFGDYAAEQVSRNLTGDYDESHGLDLVGIEFRHSSLPAGSPLLVKAGEFSRSIREELLWLREKGVLRISALSDLLALAVRFQSVATRIEVRIEKGGAITLHLLDQFLEEDYVDAFKEAFIKTFQLPIGQMIDPTPMRMGASEIYQHLLSGVDSEQVRPYQREHLDRLIEMELLRTVTRRIGRCTHANCTVGDHQYTDEKLIDCPSCQTPLVWTEHSSYKLNAKAISKSLKPILQKATGRTLSTTPHKFESHSVHRLSSKKRPGKFIHVFFNERLGPEKMEVFKRSMFPMLIIHPTGSLKAPVIDGDGIAHMGVGYALAASEDATAEKAFRSACRGVIRRLMQMEQERILRSARHSRDSIASKGADYNDRMFESDVYNIMRRLFPHSIKMGGANKPDGFSSIVYFESGHLRNPTKVNLSYDAKYSAKKDGYDFGIEEYRQIHEYMKSFNRSKQLQRDNNAYDGHIIIFNNIKHSSLANAANYLFNVDRLPRSRETFLLIFMQDNFLIKMWDLLQDHTAEASKRWYAFPEAFHLAIKENTTDGYTMLDEGIAEEIMRMVLSEPASDNPIDHDALLLDLKRFVRQRTNRPLIQDVPSNN